MASNLLSAAAAGDLARVQWLVSENSASLNEADNNGNTAALKAAHEGHLPKLQWLAKNGASVTQANNAGNTALLTAAVGAIFGRYRLEYGPFFQTVQWCLEHGGADMTERNHAGHTVWYFLGGFLREELRHQHSMLVLPIGLMHVMFLQCAPPAELVAEMSPEDAQLVEEGARLRTRLPAYIIQRRTRLVAHCPLIAPLRDLVHGYEEPTTTEELWATGLGAAP